MVAVVPEYRAAQSLGQLLTTTQRRTQRVGPPHAEEGVSEQNMFYSEQQQCVHTHITICLVRRAKLSCATWGTEQGVCRDARVTSHRNL